MVDNIQVAVRLRPLLDKEKESEWIVSSQKDCIIQRGHPSNKYFFDHVFNEKTSTEAIYNEVAKSIVHSYIEGFNGTIFAYGQTASGKSYTMSGTESECGIIPLCLMEMFETFAEKSDREYLLSVSYMEIYNEGITDLLYPTNKEMRIREDRQGAVFVNGLTEVPCRDVSDICDTLRAGNDNRTIGETNFNLRSSRAHTIFTVMLQSRPVTTDNDEHPVRVSSLNLVDLAGSEKPAAASTSVSDGGQRFKEGTYINKSLLALATVISRLSEAGSHIPYRDSKLTRILQSSLGGNSKTLIICAVSPTSVEETHSTLRFASRAKKIKNKPVINEVATSEQALKKQLHSLSEENRALLSKLKDSCTEEQRKELEAHIQDIEASRSWLENRVKCLEQYIICSTPMPHNLDIHGSPTQRRRTYCLPQQQSLTPSSVRRTQLKEQLLFSPLYKGDTSSRRKTMFISRPKEVTFLVQSNRMSISSVATDEGDLESPDLIESSPHHSSEPGSHAGTQTYADVLESCTQTDAIPLPAEECNDRGTQTNAGSSLIVPSQTDQCLFTDLNQSYLCQHRTLATTVRRDLDNALFLNDEFQVKLSEIEELSDTRETVIRDLRSTLQEREMANQAQEEMLIDLQLKLKKTKQETHQALEKQNTLQNLLTDKDSRIKQLEDELRKAGQSHPDPSLIEQGNQEFEREAMQERELLHSQLKLLTSKLESLEKTAERVLIEQYSSKSEHLKKEVDELKVLLKEREESLKRFTGTESRLNDELKKNVELTKEISGLQRSIETIRRDLEETNTSLAAEREEKNAKSEHLKKEVDELKVLLKEREESLKRFTGTESQLNDELRKNVELTEEISGLQRSVETIRRDLEETNTSLTAEREEKNEIVQKFMDLEKELDEELTKMDQLKTKNELLEKNVKSLNDELKEVRTTFEQQSALLEQKEVVQAPDVSREVEFDKLRELLKKKEEQLECFTEVETKLDEETRRNSKQAEQISQVQKSLATVTRELEETRESLKAEQEDKEGIIKKFYELEEELDEELAKINQLKIENAKLEKALESSSDDLLKSRSKIDQLLSEKKEMGQLEVLQKEFDGLKQHLEEKKKLLEFSDGKLDGERKKNGQLTEEVSQLQRSNEMVTRELEQTKEMLKAQMEERDEIVEKFMDLEKEVDEEIAKNDLLKAENAKLEKALESSSDDLLKSRSKIDQLLSEKKEMGQLEVLQKEFDGLKKNLEEKRKLLEFSDGKLDGERKKNGQLTEEVSRLQRSNDMVTKELEQTKEMLTAQLEERDEIVEKFMDLEKELDEEIAKNDLLKAENEKLEKTMMSYCEDDKTKAQVFKRELDELKLKLKEKQKGLEHYAKLKLELHDKTERNNKLTEEISSLKGILETVSKELEETKECVTAEWEERERVTQKFLELEKELDEEIAKKEEVENKNKTLEEAVKTSNKQLLEMKELNDRLRRRLEESRQASTEKQKTTGSTVTVDDGTTPDSKLELLQELCALRKENKTLIMRIRFLSLKIPISPSVGNEDTSEKAGYHRVIENLELKNKKLIKEVCQAKEDSDKAKKEMFRYREERNDFREKYNVLKKEMDEVSDKGVDASQKPYPHLHPSKPNVPKPAHSRWLQPEAASLEDELHLFSKSKGDDNKPVRMSKNNPHLFGYDWEQSMLDDPENVGKIPFDVHTVTPEKPNRPENCKQQ